ncbi:MAG TPA: LPP20 family lipoprotein [Cyclobacteriaceae bacterium]|nr:LPP20 family lipoprotein [Cyclobacteriaceae bacterium]
MKPLFILVLMAICVSCDAQKKSKKKTSKEDVQNAKPAWLSAKPNEAAYYVGIGHSVKDGTNNYIQSAKKSALEDLISEIKVNVSSSSVLTSIDVNKEFTEKYEQIINTTVADELEEYEQVDSWEDDRNYWIYYRLSKARYKEIKDQQKRDAVTLGLDFFTKAKASERAGNTVESLGFYFQGFRAIEKYLGEPIRLDFEGKEILLTNEIIASIQKQLDNITIANTPAALDLNRRVTQSGASVIAKAAYKDSGKPLADLPLIAKFEKGSGDVFPQYKTDGAGTAKILLTKITSRDMEQSLAVKVDVLSFAGQNASEIYQLVAARMVVPTANVLMKVSRPLVYLSADEKSLGVDKSTRQVTNKIKNYLATAGFEFTDDKNKSELWLDVKADSEKGSASGSIYITYVTAIIKVATTKDNKEIYATTIDRVKGYSLDYERSSQEAYNKSIDELEKQKLPELLNAILQ